VRGTLNICPLPLLPRSLKKTRILERKEIHNKLFYFEYSRANEKKITLNY
jgi:hypothetical protein